MGRNLRSRPRSGTRRPRRRRGRGGLAVIDRCRFVPVSGSQQREATADAEADDADLADAVGGTGQILVGG